MIAAIRPATEADAEGIRSLVERAYRGDAARGGWTHEADLFANDRTSLDEVLAVFADPDRTMLVATEDGQTVGTVTVARIAPQRCYLGMLAVDPAMQAGGLGRRLIAAAEGVARDRFAATTMEMTVISSRRELLDWYLRQGYAPNGELRHLTGAGGAQLPMQVLERAL
ncbi:MAG: GNAT family N-acetyltransferase [Sphingomonadales bacterium]|nr:GNAT family N-acetyltransferase [Sphingomonadales bacterium]